MHPSEQGESDFKKKRQDYSINVRRIHREEVITRRRNLPDTGDQENSPALIIVDENFRPQIEKFLQINFKQSDLQQLLTAMTDESLVEKHRAIIGIRKLLNSAPTQLIKQLCQIRAVEAIYQFAKQETYPQLRLQAIWAMANIASSTKEVCQYIVSLGCIEFFVEILNKDMLKISEQIVWALGNLAADSIQIRDRILLLEGLAKVVKYAEKLNPNNNKRISDACWTISNLCRGRPAPKYQITRVAVPILGLSLKDHLITSDQIISDCLWTLAYLTEGPKARLTRFLDTGGFPAIFRFLENPYAGVYVPALRIMGNFSTGHEEHTNALLENDFLDYVLVLLNHPKDLVRKQVSWIVSNIAAGTKQQVLKLLSKAAVIQKLVQLLKSDLFVIRSEILWVFANFERAGIPKQILTLYQVIDIVTQIKVILQESNEYVLVNGLDCLYYILKLGQSVQDPEDLEGNLMKKQIIEKGLLPILHHLQTHESKKVYNSTLKVLERFFQDDLEVDA